ncbi:8-oxo-dGTP diphosphatase [Malonomonas rubra DSM 5091]|uniref:8-oxo-dGTP diphosphatase n=1 Tax=Malonomonas rubra DSM 5091 TaxID=1122189 RepID=A0A1M6LRX9_MALRU|nr:NUDIX hydrolase [Malonomonas rubra]SHJ73933.1 8-oxo-dGTP diphosphatase [Malonomonas rubra DSM 5091]
MDYQKQSIKTSVVACIIDQRNRVLLTRRCIEPFCSQWVMPGGKIDHGEPIIAALHREVREEIGIDIRVERLIDVYEHVNVGSKNDHFVILYYRVAPLTFDLTPNGTECTEAKWFDTEELHSLLIPPGGRHILNQVYPDLNLPCPETDSDRSQELPGATSLSKSDAKG